jgi:hypothetical protein
MVGDHDTNAWGPIDGPAADKLNRVFFDPDGSLAGTAAELRAHLAVLAEERLVARDSGVKDSAYLEDLKLEIADTSFVHAGAVILELALLRAGLNGRRQG